MDCIIIGLVSITFQRQGKALPNISRPCRNKCTGIKRHLTPQRFTAESEITILLSARPECGQQNTPRACIALLHFLLFKPLMTGVDSRQRDSKTLGILRPNMHMFVHPVQLSHSFSHPEYLILAA